MSGANKKSGYAWLWAGAGCFVLLAVPFTLAWMAVVYNAVQEFGLDGYTPPDFTPAVHIGDGLLAFEEVASLSDAESDGGELRAFDGALYALIDDWVYIYDPVTGDVAFDPVESWYTYLTPYDGGRAMGYLMMSYESQETVFYGADWEQRWAYAPEAPAEGLSAYLEGAASADLDGDGAAAEIVLLTGYYEEDDYDYGSTASAIGSVLKDAFSEAESEGRNILTAVDETGDALWTAEPGPIYSIASADVDAAPGDEILAVGADTVMVFDGATGAEREALPLDATHVGDIEIVQWPGEAEALMAVGDGIAVYDFASGAVVRDLDYDESDAFWYVGCASVRLQPGAAPYLAVLQSGHDENYDYVCRLRLYRNDGELVYDEASGHPFTGVAAMPQDDGADALYLLAGATLWRARMTVDAH